MSPMRPAPMAARRRQRTFHPWWLPLVALVRLQPRHKRKRAAVGVQWVPPESSADSSDEDQHETLSELQEPSSRVLLSKSELSDPPIVQIPAKSTV
jgi:hypothetical protein